MNVEIVQFHGDNVTAIVDDAGGLWVAMRPLVLNLGLSWSNQWEKLKGDTRFSSTLISTTASDGKKYESLCIPMKQLNGWLFTVNVNKVRSDLRDRLIEYQMECMDVLYKHFVPRAIDQVARDRIEEIGREAREGLESVRQEYKTLLEPARKALGTSAGVILNSLKNKPN